MRLTSADPTALPDVRLQLCSAPGDMDRMLAAYRAAWEIVNTEPFMTTVDAFALVDDGLVSNDEALTGRLTNTVASLWNLLGGACMGSPDDPNAVVDDRCSVIGVEGLSVVDLSVVPVPIQAPAALTAMMIGEHAVDLLP
jgi:choline dehydrogenase